MPGLAGLVTAAAAAVDLRAMYEQSAARCTHGHKDGVIVTVHDHLHPRDFAQKLRNRSQTGDEVLSHFEHVGRHVAARLTPESLAALFADEHAKSIKADCIVRRIEMPHMPRLLPPDMHARPAADSPAIRAAMSLSRQDGSAAKTFQLISGVMNRSSEYPEYFNWGTDRVDSTLYLDNQYRYGGATGRGTRLYHLDTGIFVDHHDFGGRALPGFSAGCPTGAEAECGTQWLHRGVLRHAPELELCRQHGMQLAFC